MTQTPQSTTAPTSAPSQVYTWEPSNAAIAARYGLRPEDVLRFDTNTSPLPPPFAADVLTGAFDPPLNEYPDSSYADLTAAAAAYTGVTPEQVIVGAGADEVLDLVAKAFLAPGTAALVPIPTYPMYGVLTTQRGARILAVPRRDGAHGFGLDLPKMVERLAEAAVVWLCSPNNPTGVEDAPIDLKTILSVAAELDQPPLVVVDEAYFEFSGVSLAASINDFGNLLIVRTLSKAFALAGARVGWAVGSRSVIERLERVRPPGSISTVSATLGARALGQPEYARANVAALKDEQRWLSSQLDTVGWQTWPSICNFLLARIGDQDAAEHAADTMLRAGIVPRTFGPANPLRGHLRLTVRTRTENERLVEVIRGAS